MESVWWYSWQIDDVFHLPLSYAFAEFALTHTVRSVDQPFLFDWIELLVLGVQLGDQGLGILTWLSYTHKLFFLVRNEVGPILEEA